MTEEKDYSEPVTNKTILDSVNNMISYLDHLSPSAMMSPITHYDYQSLLLVFRAFLEVACKDDI